MRISTENTLSCNILTILLVLCIRRPPDPSILEAVWLCRPRENENAGGRKNRLQMEMEGGQRAQAQAQQGILFGLCKNCGAAHRSPVPRSTPWASSTAPRSRPALSGRDVTLSTNSPEETPPQSPTIGNGSGQVRRCMLRSADGRNTVCRQNGPIHAIHNSRYHPRPTPYPSKSSNHSSSGRPALTRVSLPACLCLPARNDGHPGVAAVGVGPVQIQVCRRGSGQLCV